LQALFNSENEQVIWGQRAELKGMCDKVQPERRKMLENTEKAPIIHLYPSDVKNVHLFKGQTEINHDPSLTCI
jgi:hypothetical protein